MTVVTLTSADYDPNWRLEAKFWRPVQEGLRGDRPEPEPDMPLIPSEEMFGPERTARYNIVYAGGRTLPLEPLQVPVREVKQAPGDPEGRNFAPSNPDQLKMMISDHYEKHKETWAEEFGPASKAILAALADERYREHKPALSELLELMYRIADTAGRPSFELSRIPGDTPVRDAVLQLFAYDADRLQNAEIIILVTSLLVADGHAGSSLVPIIKDPEMQDLAKLIYKGLKAVLELFWTNGAEEQLIKEQNKVDEARERLIDEQERLDEQEQLLDEQEQRLDEQEQRLIEKQEQLDQEKKRLKEEQELDTVARRQTDGSAEH
ncbi:uncharacterized protein B0I36DRAFT_370341 [Microdochium trichocladiopsis]|uniref:Uncharacterized protein n=1 Tax=Microdochium trichocladiopsis TaxID=1682393 RepID=A0A9P8XR85_9PEZI|nr:uncharacterized protein B0I36DRAFT_370341 [Microdochium trichocladiopsis]KAH7009395.1 hypothetical protein B0I36DRAFT_370341 [Microdochium trichocladiopsis]